MNYTDSDSENEDIRAPIDPEIVEELLLDSRLKCIDKFKDVISKEDIFTNIHKISSIDLFNEIEKFKIDYYNILSTYQIELFDDLYLALYGSIGNSMQYNHMFNFIQRKTVIYK